MTPTGIPLFVTQLDPGSDRPGATDRQGGLGSSSAATTSESSACAAVPAGWPLRLLCDEMLKGIGRWLRAAGYDTLIARSGTPDADLLAFAKVGGRVLLTCDRRLGRLPGHDAMVVTLDSEALDAAADELRRRLGIDWLQAPFTRCLVDNAPLRPAGAQELARAPDSARCGDETVSACPECARVYWPGSHVRRMRARLEHWRQTL